MKTPHTGCKKGKRVVVTLRDGRRIHDVFEDRTDRFVILRDHGRIDKKDIRAFQIAREA